MAEGKIMDDGDRTEWRRLRNRSRVRAVAKLN
jgi:hypothetical protein